jgi:hypothetical protein
MFLLALADLLFSLSQQAFSIAKGADQIFFF